MTDKQMIIDGVDVSGCYQYMPRYMEDYDIDTLDYCRYHFKPCKDVDVKYCYYKQLKRKEQECEELKEDRERWKSNFNGKVSAIEELLKQLDQLKVEFDKKELIFAGIETSNKLLIEKNNKLKQTLTEIKEIAENVQSFVGRINIEDDVFEQMEQILQKISEVENEN